MAPPCIGLMGFSALNRPMAPDAWHVSRSASIPKGQLAGEIALSQLKYYRHYLVENPRSSELYELHPWNIV
eukprot:12938255-Prorocentrum_lima.AAC.1